MNQNRAYNVELMFSHACVFVDCAKFCELESRSTEYRTHSHNVASIVNSAFACEVFIKTLFTCNGIGQIKYMSMI